MSAPQHAADFGTDKNERLGVSAKPLILLMFLVGGAGFEPATPAV
jgi:hypothetical protein